MRSVTANPKSSPALTNSRGTRQTTAATTDMIANVLRTSSGES